MMNLILLKNIKNRNKHKVKTLFLRYVGFKNGNCNALYSAPS